MSDAQLDSSRPGYALSICTIRSLVTFIVVILIGIPIDGLAAGAIEGPSSQDQGHADRVAYETWIRSLKAEQRQGADFWAAERSKPQPASCISNSNSQNFALGCQEAQRRLTTSDTRRKSEPAYRKGWNAPVIEAAQVNIGNTTSFSANARSLRIFSQNYQVISPAIGLSSAHIINAFPKADCSGNFCEFDRGQSPQNYCPRAGTCSQLTLFISGMIIAGYSADFDVLDWSRSLELSMKLLGPPQKNVVGPRSLVRMRNEYWKWPVGNGLTLTYTATSGVDAYGSPLNAHSIALASDND